jgi:hypothetical protein
MGIVMGADTATNAQTAVSPGRWAKAIESIQILKLIMRVIKFAAYLFYRFYRRHPQKGIPYFRTIASLTLLSLMNVLFVACLFGKGNFIQKAVGYFLVNQTIVILILVSLTGTLILLLIKEKDLKELGEKYETNTTKIKTGNLRLIIYCIISFALVILGAFWNKYINS